MDNQNDEYPSNYDIWVATTVKKNIKLMNKKLRKLRPNGFLLDIWHLICNYTLEDLKIVDQILYTKSIHIGSSSLRLLLPYQDHYIIHLLELYTHLEEPLQGYRIYERLLLLPKFNSDSKCESECESMSSNMLEIRYTISDKLVTMIYRMRKTNRLYQQI